MSQNTSGFYKIFSYPIFYSLTQKIMSGVSTRALLVKNVINKNAKVLDIGCGTAKIIESLPPLVDYYGYDISKKCINYAKKKYKSKTNNFYCKKFNIKEINKLPKFDFILLFGIMHHLDDEELYTIFPILKKTLKKNGTLITCDPIFKKKQNIIANFLVKSDVGNNVRYKSGYLKLLKKHFNKINSKIQNQAFIPYTWFSTQCKK